MMKAMLSQPMAGKSEEEIRATREYERARCGADPALFSGKEFRKNVAVSCSLFLQRLGTDKRLPVGA